MTEACFSCNYQKLILTLKIIYMYICTYTSVLLEWYMKSLTGQRKFWRVRTTGSNGQTAQRALLLSVWIKPPSFLSSTTQVKIPSPRTESIASHAHLLARERQGPLNNSLSQAACLTKMSRLCYGKRQWTGENKCAPHGVSVHFWQEGKKKKKHVHWHKTWIQSSSQKVEYLHIHIFWLS